MFHIKKEVVQNIGKLATGSIIAQVIAVIVSPISTRIFTPEEMGMYTLLLTVVYLFGTSMNLRYDITIVSAKDEEEAHVLVVLCVILAFIMTCIIGVCYSLYIKDNSNVTEIVGKWVYVIPIILFVTGITNVLTSYNNRNKQYSLISKMQVIRATVQNGAMIGFGYLGMGTIGLLIAQLLGVLAGVKQQSKQLFDNIHILKKVNKSDLKKVLIKYKAQPLYSMPAIFLNSLGYSTINFIISGLYGVQVFGYYSLTYRIMGLPLSIIGANISKVFFQQATEEYKREGNFVSIFLKTTIILVVIALPMIACIFLFGPTIFKILFGSEWVISGEYAKMLALMYGIRLITATLTTTFIIGNKQHIEVIMQILFIVSAGFTYIVCKLFGFNEMIFLYMINFLHSIIYIGIYIAMLKISKCTNDNREKVYYEVI